MARSEAWRTRATTIGRTLSDRGRRRVARSTSRSAAADHPLRAHAGPIVATVLLVAFVLWAWSGLWVDAPAGTLTLAFLAATVPAIVSVLPLRRAGALSGLAGLAGAFLVAAAATDVSMQSLLRLRRTAWGSIASILDQGLAGAATISIPLPADERSRAVSAALVVLIAMAAFLIAAIGIVTRRPLAAVVAAGIALAYRWTLAPPAHPLRDGLIAAAVVLLAFVLMRARPWSRPQGALRTGGAAVCVLTLAGLLSIGADGDAWWDWRSWRWGADGDANTTVLSLDQTYGPLRYPANPVELARISTDRIAPLRAITLDRFDGRAFVQTSGELLQEDRVEGRLTLPQPTSSGAGERIGMNLHLTGTRTPWLFTAGAPVAVERLGRRDVRVFADGSLAVDPALGKGTRYGFTTVVGDPGPAKLLALRGYADIDVDHTMLSVEPVPGADPVVARAWGTGGDLPAPEEYGPFAEFARNARAVVGDAKTPYAAVNRIESYLRADPFTYDETVAAAVGQPELVNFVLSTKTGYCQHFAGAMTLMLRMNGIPAREVVGLNVNASRYDASTQSYRIVDRDAHTWVEVDFGPELGWLPFEPTRGRSAPNSASVSSGNYVRPEGSVEVTSSLNEGPVNPVPTPTTRPEPTVPTGGPIVEEGASRWWWLLLLPPVALALAVVPSLLKAARRARRRRGDERARVLGAARELEAFLTDLGRAPEVSATAVERADDLSRRLGIDARRIYGLANQARFAGAPPAPGSGAEAWSEFARVRRRVGWKHRVRAAVRTRSLHRRGDRDD